MDYGNRTRSVKNICAIRFKFKKTTYQMWEMGLKKLLDIFSINTHIKEDKGLKISELSISFTNLENKQKSTQCKLREGNKIVTV